MRTVLLGFAAACAFGSSAAPAQDTPRRSPTDAVSRLARRLDTGQTRLEARGDALAYVPGLLSALGVRTDTQTLVFAKNSLQSARISPRTPRAIYFNDHVYVGFIPGSEMVELIAVDPIDGLQFSTFDNRTTAGPPRFEPQTTMCNGCHGRGRQAFLTISSVIPDKNGRPFLAIRDTGPIETDHRTPFERRWGGWYVTGTHGGQRHMGNAVARLPLYPFDLEQEGTQNLTTIAGKVDTSAFPAATSDIVALMTLEHQARMTNLLLRIGQRSRAGAASAPGAPPLDPAVDDLVAYMLFADEARLREPVAGTSTFAMSFPDQGPRDTRGRSLRDFDLKTRLFRFPLSYLIYSAAFDAIAPPVKSRIYQRLLEVLTGKDTSGTFAHLSATDRRALLEIVADTKPGVPAAWTRAASR